MERRIGIIMNGITGRMGLNQHLIRSVLAIRDDGGLLLTDGSKLMPDPILVGRNKQKLEEIASRFSVDRYTTDLDNALENTDDSVFFDSATTKMRVEILKKAISAGKHIYCEKPVADDLQGALEIAKYASQKGVKNGVVHDKLYLPGLIKLKRLRDAGFFGKILSVRGEFGYWVFDGEIIPAQRPSWNYRKSDGGGIIKDMLCHWRYVLDNVIAPVKSVSCAGKVHISKRWDESGQKYDADADDAAYASFELEGGIMAQINSSWCVRVKREDLVTFQVDGTLGSAVAGLHKCSIQHHLNTPKPTWNPDQPQTLRFHDHWMQVPDNADFGNGFRTQWEEFLRHVAEDGPWKYDLFEGAKGVQLAECASKSWKERRWIDIPEIQI